ncbi:unnamed protein product [Rotaria sp. Silwood2]|nr:unnamed protein product [Rotaria sp. Silwood2]CAF2865507.1 unnamed protein product [Rotaria sp. Silwood2]CAF3112563.1 unnamed protein product [Rotaria sp. Silwood2]CAF3301088.1 unnamed protein product [Rotaria sp. Silwood2]CAF4187183.1 unnamed protein product [Rotaria sp. Silwood2]
MYGNYYVVVLSSQELHCRCLMSNPTCWPNASVWQNFNESIDGRLVSVRSTASFCVGNPPNMEVCNSALSQWTNSTWRADQIGSMQNYNWENVSCSGDPGNVTCTQGSIPRLGINATTVEHVLATIRLASVNNLRLVIKSTGHDYLGRSTAADSLLLWLHHMKNMNLLEQYTSCTGEIVSNAIRLSAGVQWGEVYSWLARYKLIAIGGISSTVGAIGGYLQGGGHGPLSRWKGMAADQVLEFDVVTADGQRRTVNACQNQDLFWALRGGGGQTFAVVLSAVLRTFPSPSIVSTIYSISATNEVRYARLILDFIRFMPTLADVDYSGYFYLIDLTLNIVYFVPNGNFTVVTSIFNEFMKNNKDLQFNANFTTMFPTFYDYFTYIMNSSDSSGGHVLFGSRLIPETIVRQQPDQLAEVLFRIRGRSKNQSIIGGHFVAGGEVSKVSINNSINPAWRTALMQIIFIQGWYENTSAADQTLLASHLRTQVELLQTVAGGSQSSCYLNEADPNEPDWQQKFFGTQAHYNRLKSIKNAVDPNGLFICKNCVGSDDWSTDLNCPKNSMPN